MKSDCYDVVIVGGGIVGCCVAYHLVRLEGGLSVAIVERDSSYQLASTTLSLANVRVQFSLRENILISLNTMEVLERFEEEMAVDGEAPALSFRREGNLFLVDEGGCEDAQSALGLQRSLGCRVEWLTPEEIDVCECDRNLKFVKKHVVKSGYTRLGIQTAAFADGR